MAKFDFNRSLVGINSDDVVAQFLSYGPLKKLALSVHTDTDFQLQPNGPRIHYSGKDFEYNGKGDPVSGTIKKIDTYVPHHSEFTYKMTGLNLDIAEMKTALKTHDVTFVFDIFAGNDKFLGGHKNDKFYGFGGNDKMTGNDGNDSLDGGANNDTLDGGRGNDKLTGGDGNDTFRFTQVIRQGNNVDTITDFTAAQDKLELDHTVFIKLDLGKLDAAHFAAGEVADHKDAGIIYDANGDLWWDVKGRDAAKFAHLDGHPEITFDQIFIV